MRMPMSVSTCRCRKSARELGDSTGCKVAFELELDQTILSRDITLDITNVCDGLTIDMRIAVLVAHHVDRRT